MARASAMVNPPRPHAIHRAMIDDALQTMRRMPSPRLLLCLFRDHQPDRQSVWHDNLNLRAPCRRCRRSLIRGFPSGWRAFMPKDLSLERDSQETVQMRRARVAQDQKMHPDARLAAWSRQIVALLGGASETGGEAEALFWKLAEILSANADFVAAVEVGKLTGPARTAIADATAEIVRSDIPPQPAVLEQVAQYIFARAVTERHPQSGRSARTAASTGIIGTA